IPAALAIDAGVVGDEADTLTLEGLKLLFGEDIETGLRRSVAPHLAAGAGSGGSLVISGERDVLHRHPNRRGGHGGDASAKRRDGWAEVGVNAIGQQDHVALGGWIDPD